MTSEVSASRRGVGLATATPVTESCGSSKLIAASITVSRSSSHVVLSTDIGGAHFGQVEGSAKLAWAIFAGYLDAVLGNVFAHGNG